MLNVGYFLRANGPVAGFSGKAKRISYRYELTWKVLVMQSWTRHEMLLLLLLRIS